MIVHSPKSDLKQMKYQDYFNKISRLLDYFNN